MKLIHLTQGQSTIVDDVDYEKYRFIRWQAIKGRYTWYARSTIGYLHHHILNVQNLEVDHIDGNGLNNQKENLRLATRAENARNCKLQRNNTSGFHGVSYQKQINRWMAYIKVNGKRKYIGVYETKEAAALAYNKAAKQYHGEFAKFNDVTLLPDFSQ
jgi:hypothetical protein